MPGTADSVFTNIVKKQLLFCATYLEGHIVTAVLDFRRFLVGICDLSVEEPLVCEAKPVPLSYPYTLSQLRPKS